MVSPGDKKFFSQQYPPLRSAATSSRSLGSLVRMKKSRTFQPRISSITHLAFVRRRRKLTRRQIFNRRLLTSRAAAQVLRLGQVPDIAGRAPAV